MRRIEDYGIPAGAIPVGTLTPTGRLVLCGWNYDPFNPLSWGEGSACRDNAYEYAFLMKEMDD